jgi:hypothetical protein
MPNTKADLARLKLRMVTELPSTEEADELLALCERLLGERDEAREDRTTLLIAADNALEKWVNGNSYAAEMLILERMSGNIRRRLLTPNETNKEGENR